MRKKKRFIGFTNIQAMVLIGVLILCIILSFILAIYSIKTQYMGSLACWTVFSTPLNAGITIVLTATVNKNKAENIGPDGVGVRYKQLLQEEGDKPTI